MAERPLLVLPAAARPLKRANKGGGGGPVHVPTRARQGQRLGPRLTALQAAFDAQRVRLQSSAQGVAPEQVVVLETVSPIEDFLNAVRKVEGLEWLGEFDENDIPPSDDFFVPDKADGRTEKALNGRMFLVFSNQQALRQILSMWTSWLASGSLPRGLTPWRNVFAHLKDVRVWGVEDRLLETGVLDDWRERITQGMETVPCEIEMWQRTDATRQREARTRVEGLVTGLGGKITARSSILEIGYQALLADLPIAAIRPLLDNVRDAELVQCEQIQFFRAAGQMSVAITRGDDTRDAPVAAATGSGKPPLVALFDGLPLQNHRRLAGRLYVDDPDDFGSDYPAADRVHGTAMASLIINGDLNVGSNKTIKRLLYTRPILRPDARAWMTPRPETVPGLPVDLIYRAVRRLFEGDGQQPPTAPTVRVINLSIGIRDRPFDNALSPLAKLLDWLAWKYRILFVVSAGNHAGTITLPIGADELPTLTAQEFELKLIQAVAADSRHRRLLSPAEGLNILTVAATHDDGSDGAPPANSRAPFVAAGLPSIINAQGLGYRRSIKPELLLSGGRVLLEREYSTETESRFGVFRQNRPPGHAVASPGREGDVNYKWHTSGTSNAAALASRSCHFIDEMLDELESAPGGTLINTIPRALWMKALLAHGAQWGRAGEVFEQALQTEENKRQFREYVARLLGYGSFDESRVLGCTPQRVTTLAGGTLSEDQAHEHRLPLPPSLSGKTGLRRVIGSLAWFTPINVEHRGWRRAHLWFGTPTSQLKIDRTEADWQAAQRGTLQHEIFEGDRAAAFVDGSDLVVQVNCRADAGGLEDPVPYALAITLEVSDAIGIDVYTEIRTRVQARIRVTAART